MTPPTPRVRRTRRRLASSLVVASLLSLVTPASSMAASEPTEPTPGPPAWLRSTRNDDHPPALASALQDDAEARRAVPSAGTAAVESDDVTVVVEATDAEAALTAIDAAGGTVEVATGNRVKASVPAASLDRLATAAGVTSVREPNPVRLSDVSQGVIETGADDWQALGTDGTGTKIAIVDGGFQGYSSLLGTDLPATVETDFTRCGGNPNTGGDHGTAVTEIVHDMAPGATLRLVCIDDDVEFVSALATMAANGVDVVNGSIGFFLASRGDGSGASNTVNGAVAALRGQDILYVAAAGNSGERHFNANASGDTQAVSLPIPDSDRFDDLVNISDGDVFEVTVAPGGVVFVGVQWDAWPTTTLDFDLFVGNTACPFAGFSQGDQASEGGAPVEATVFQNCLGSQSVFEVVIDRWSGTGSPRMDFFFDGDVVSIENKTNGSLPDPATSPAAMSVGAHCHSTGAAQTYSSRGPTIDGRVKPDISGPDAVSTTVYGSGATCSGGFTGTSASAPHVTGAAALLLEENPDLDVAELQQLLEDRAQDVGTAGKDNTYGAGRLRLAPAGNALLAPPQPFSGMTPQRLFDSRPGLQFPAESPNRTTPLGPNGKVQVQVRGLVGVPVDATAVVLNVTAVSPTAAGYVTVHPGGTVPNASNLNFAIGQNVAVHVTATVGSNGKVELVNALGNTHLIVDIAGWYGPTGAAGPSTDRFTPLTAPARALDSRPGSPQGYAEGAFGPSGRTTPIPEGGDMSVQVAGLGGVPVAATAVVMNVTAVAPTKGTFVTAYPTGETRPEASNLNAKVSQTIANLVVMPVGTNGEVTFYNQLGNTHLVVDVVGWFQPNVGAGYVALDPPTRTLDTRTGTGLRRTFLGLDGTHKLRVGHYNGVPADAAAVMLGVVAVSQSAVTASWLTVYPGTSALPATSSVNFGPGATIANAVVARLGTDGTVAFNNARGNTHVISDLAGYFIDPANVPVPLP